MQSRLPKWYNVADVKFIHVDVSIKSHVQYTQKA